MLTIEKLKAFGANAEEGLARCINNEAFYLMLVNKVISDNKTEQLEHQLADKELDAAFETAHALKGTFANLSLDPLTKPVSELTEILRGGTDKDTSPLMEEIKKQLAALRALSAD